MNAYILVFMSWISTGNGTGGYQISQQEYTNMESCTNAAKIISAMSRPDNAKVQWTCVPKKN